MSGAEFKIVEFIPEPIFVFEPYRQSNTSDKSHVIRWLNPAAEAWLRQSCRTLQGKRLEDISPDFGVVTTRLAEAMDKHGSFRGRELSIQLTESRRFLCSYLIFPCQNGMALLMKPRQIGLGLNPNNSREGAVTMLGRMLAHELKNPLAGIRGAAQLLESELKTEDDLELTSLITTEVDRIGRLVEKIEQFGTDEETIFESFNVHSILRNAKLLFQSQSSQEDIPEIKLMENYDPSLPEVYGDRDALMQVIINLIANATEAIRLGGNKNISDGMIEIKTLYRTGINRRLVGGGTQALPVEIQIIDNGPGVSEKLREKVFQPFVTGKANGHGLGLALVSTVVERHGGLVDLASKPGRTVFSLLLPISPVAVNESHIRIEE